MDDQLSTNFKRSEFACKCGCGRDTVDEQTLELCEIVREFVGVSIIPSSGHRCPKHNKNEGGGRKSQHLYGRAADLPVPDPLAVYVYLDNMFPGKFGLGLYDDFVHVDSRTNGPARWDNRTVKT